MATVTGLTAEKMQEIVDTTIVGAHINGDDLILELYDSTEINAGNVRGPQGIQGPAADVGDIKASIRTSITGWMHLNGDVITDANLSMAALWAVVPTSWKVGNDLHLPNMTNRVLQGGGSVTGNLGGLNGANVKTLVEANLPPHAHTITHDHADATTDTEPAHAHVIFRRRSQQGAASATENEVTGADPASGASTNADTGNAGAHNHTVNIPTFTGSSGTGAGSSTPVSVEQAALVINYFIKY